MPTNLVYSSIALRGNEPAPGTRKATMRPLGSFAGPAKTLNSTSCIKSATSTNFNGIRISGLSDA